MTYAPTPKQLAILDTLHPALKARALLVLDRIGWRLVPLSGHRTVEEQARLYEKGRAVVWGPQWTIKSETVTSKKAIVTNAPPRLVAPFDSAHCYKPARAVDCVLNPIVIGAANLRTTTFAGKTYPDLWDTRSPDAVRAWDDYGEAAKEVGLVWGGTWRMRDMPHVELPDAKGKLWDDATT